MSTAITPEVMGLETHILEESPMTESEEKELVIVKTTIKTAYADKLERDLAIGAGLLQIFRRKLYRGKEGGRTWEQWLEDESAELTSGRGRIEQKTSQYLRGFYQFRCEVLQLQSPGSASIPLPATPKQVRPLLGQLETHPKAAIEMWKAAVTEAKGKVPTFDQVNRAALAYKANKDNEARRLSAAEKAARQKGSAASKAARSTTPETGPVKDYSPEPEDVDEPAISAWEIEKDDSSIDAGEECKRISRAINEVKQAVGNLRGILYSQIHKYGSDYLTFLRQVDAGAYSINDIDEHVQQIGEDVAFIADLLVAEVGEGELSQSTIDVDSYPTR